MDGDLLIKAAASLTPALVLLLVFAYLDVFKLVRLSRIALFLLAGGALAVAGYFANAAVLDALAMGIAPYSRYVAPLVEEALKASFVLALFAGNKIGFKLDAAVIGFAVGAGFSVVENVWYLYVFPEANPGVAMVRGFGTAVMHGGATALFAAISHEMTERQAQARAAHYRFNPLLYLPGLAAAVAVHAVFNQFTGQPLLLMTVTLVAVPLTLFVVFAMGERSSHQWLLSDNRNHQKVLEDVRSGRFAESETGKAVHELCRRFRGGVADDVFNYIELHTQLVIEAEQVLLALKEGRDPDVGADDREKFERLRALEKRIGKAALSALRPHLHFTRNDIWEMCHFEARSQDAD